MSISLSPRYMHMCLLFMGNIQAYYHDAFENPSYFDVGRNCRFSVALRHPDIDTLRSCFSLKFQLVWLHSAEREF